LCRAAEYGSDGGKAVELMRPKLDAFYTHVQSNLHITLPLVEVIDFVISSKASP
jgi:hypothetical protein